MSDDRSAREQHLVNADGLIDRAQNCLTESQFQFDLEDWRETVRQLLECCEYLDRAVHNIEAAQHDAH